MATIQSPTVPGQIAEVNAESELKVGLTLDGTKAGFINIQDANGNPILTTENGALDVSLDGVVLFEQVDGAALNTNIWITSTDTMTVTQSGGFINLNANSTTTANKYAILNSIKSIPLYGYLPLKISINAKVPIQPQSNAIMELGVGTAGTNAAPSDGAFFRWGSDGTFKAVVNNGGVEQQSIALTPPTSNVTHLYDIIIVEDEVEFFIDDEQITEILVGAAQSFPVNAGRQTVFCRTYNGNSAPGAAPQINIGQVVVVQQAMNQNKGWADTLSALGRGAYQSPVTPFTQTANHANSTSPVSATLSNTAAGYATLGGRYQFAMVSGAATDFALFAYQVPTGYQLYINAISVNAQSIGAIGGVTSTTLDWAIGLNSSAVSLATSEAPSASWAPRRIPIGTQGFTTLTPISTSAIDIYRQFPNPLVADGGRYVHIILQIPVGTNTANQIIRGDVQINGYFE